TGVVDGYTDCLCAGMNRHSLDDRDIYVDPRGVRVYDGDSGAHELLALAAIELLAQVGQLDAVVRAFDLPQIIGDRGRHSPAGLTGEADDIGEVLLTLGVVGRQGRQSLLERDGVEGVDARVDLADGAFVLVR